MVIPRQNNMLISTFEVVQTILALGSFTIALVSLCYKIFKENDKK
ncbi:putative holin-like toxin [Streptococcus suis]|nr:putative holin-like toxin [Streptococcus suis]NQP57837.1 putative holin-like toxin [Streptococcus suis]